MSSILPLAAFHGESGPRRHYAGVARISGMDVVRIFGTSNRGANLSNGQVRAWPRQSLHARRRWRHAGHVRSRPGTGAGGCGGAHGVSSASAMSNPAASFEPYRRRLLGLAYRMLGSMADTEDAVQETYLRWHATDRDKVSDP